MLESNDKHLESELIRIVYEHSHPLNLEEIFSCLYDRRDRLADLVAISKETILEKRKVKRHLDLSAHRGLLETSWENGQVYYKTRATESDRNSSTFRLAVIHEKDLSSLSQPHGFRSKYNFHDTLLTIFCIVALTVISAAFVFLIFT